MKKKKVWKPISNKLNVKGWNSNNLILKKVPKKIQSMITFETDDLGPKPRINLIIIIKKSYLT